jgi:hypothetical protein
MLTSSKQARLLDNLKKYSKKYLNGKIKELDESGTRLMINHFLTEALGFAPIEEIKTEYMIKGTYADYVIQIKGVEHFLVEVKAFTLELSDKHLRQAVHYGADQGIDWALLTNGKTFELYKIIVDKSVEHRKIFSIDMSDIAQIKSNIDILQYLHRDSVTNKGLAMLWNKCTALDPANVAGLLYTPKVVNFIKGVLKAKYKHKFSDEDVKESLDKIVYEAISLEHVNKNTKIKKGKGKTNAVSKTETPAPAISTPVITHEPTLEKNSSATMTN